MMILTYLLILMHFNIVHKITVGNYQLATFESVKVSCSVELLQDTCSITLPECSANQLLKIEEKLTPGDKVTVQFGYDSLPDYKEFEGYLNVIRVDGGSVVLECEDEIYMFRKPVANKQFTNVNLKAIVQYVIDDIGLNVKLDCTSTIDYEEFVIFEADGVDVLKKLQEETASDVFIKYEDGQAVLHFHPKYEVRQGEVLYSMQHNVETSDLKYRRKEDRKIQIVLKYTGTDGKEHEYSYGTTGGEKITKEMKGVSKESMKLIAENEYKMRVFDGYEGGVNTWAIPFVAPSFTAKIVDEDYPDYTGRYYVTAVDTECGPGGIQRNVKIGLKLS